MSKPKIRTSFNDKYPSGQRIGTCKATGKVQYPSEAEAFKDIRRVRKRNKARLHAYFCNFCGAWHNGHDRAPSRRKRMTAKDKFLLHQITPRVDPDLVVPPDPEPETV